MNLSFRNLLFNRNVIWASALVACTAASFIVGGQMQEHALPSAIMRLEKLQGTLVAQQEEFEEARVNAERRIAVLGTKVAEMKAALVQMETWQISLEEMGGGAAFKPASAEFINPPLGYGVTAPRSRVDLIVELNLLSARMNHRFEELRAVADALTAEGSESMFAPSGWPVDTRHITSYRGFRKDPFSGNRDWHDGVDIDGEMGDPIYAVASGIVTWAGRRNGYGELVEISHSSGYVTRYAHNSLNLVAVGDYVQRSQEIARLGRTGRAKGSHLHFEILRNGAFVNPIDFLRKAP